MTSLCTEGSGQSEQFQVNRSRRGRSSSMNWPVTYSEKPPSSMSMRSDPPTVGSRVILTARAGRGHIHSVMPVHLRARDVSFTAVSRAPIGRIAAYKQRMGWSFRWVSAGETDFNHDFGASFTPEEVASHAAVFNYGSEPGFEDREGISVFARDEQGRVYHTYSTYARGIDPVNAAYQFLDLTPKGRDEPVGGDPQFWVRRHDEYSS